MQWNGDQYLAEAERTYGDRVRAAGIYLQSRIRENISIPSRTVGVGIISKGKNKGQTKKILGARGSNRSKPGEFPHKDYGLLRQSIATDYDQSTLTARIGSALSYAKYLELGTRKMRPRPFLRRTLAEERETIRQMIELGGRTDIEVT